MTAIASTFAPAAPASTKKIGHQDLASLSELDIPISDQAVKFMRQTGIQPAWTSSTMYHCNVVPYFIIFYAVDLFALGVQPN